MAGGKEIRAKIKSIKNMQKITHAMEMVATSKMRRAQERTRSARPYAEKIREMAAHLGQAFIDYPHPFLIARPHIQKIGLIVITSDKGLCGGLNTNALRLSLEKMQQWHHQGIEIVLTTVGAKGASFLSRVGAKIISSIHHLGDIPRMEQLVAPVKVMIDAFVSGEVDEVHIVYTRFVNTMKQEPVCDMLLPLSGEAFNQHAVHKHRWEYLYEPNAKTVVDDLMRRYLESVIYQSVAENMASEQSARMVAMKAASDNAEKVIGHLQCLYNKTRQTAITTELSEIVAGAAAV